MKFHALLSFGLAQAAKRDGHIHLIVSVVSGTVLLAAKYVEPSKLPPICLFRAWTGLPCMTCGMTRAFHAIALGEFLEAFQYHPLGPIFYLAFYIHFCVSSWYVFRGADRPAVSPIAIGRMVNWALVLLSVCWIARLMLGMTL